MVHLCRPVVLTLASIVMALLPATFEPPRSTMANSGVASTESVAAARGADLFVEPDFIVLPTYVSGDVARLRITVQSRSDAPVEIEQIEIRDLRFTVRVPAGWSGSGIDRVACDPPLRIEPRGSLALEFETGTRTSSGFPRAGLYRKTIVVKVRGNAEPIRLAEVSARVVLGYSMTPGGVDFGEVRRGEKRSLEAVVETDELGPIRILSIRPPPSQIASLPFSVTAPTEAEPKRSRRNVVTVKLDPSAAVGQYNGIFDLETDSPQRVTIPLQVHARVLLNLELRVRGLVVDLDLPVNLGVLRRGSDPVEIVVRDTKTDSDWHPGDATLTVAHKEGDASIDPKFEIETASGSTAAERRIRVRLLELGSRPLVSGEFRLPLHHVDLDELVLGWTAFLRDR
jgi:hypothetical protein